MLKNYLKVTLRNLAKNLSHTAINVLGLTHKSQGNPGFLVVSHAMSFDNYHAKKDRIYRVVTQSKESTGTSETTGVPVPLTEQWSIIFQKLNWAALFRLRKQWIGFHWSEWQTRIFQNPMAWFSSIPTFIKSSIGSGWWAMPATHSKKPTRLCCQKSSLASISTLPMLSENHPI